MELQEDMMGFFSLLFVVDKFLLCAHLELSVLLPCFLSAGIVNTPETLSSDQIDSHNTSSFLFESHIKSRAGHIFWTRSTLFF